MKIIVGSINRVKVRAVTEISFQYDILKDAEIYPYKAKSRVSAQPKSLSETVIGSQNRALGAFHSQDLCSLSFGIESGLMDVPGTKTGCMDVCVCTIFDGREFHMGLSAAFECPPVTIEMARKENIDLNQAFKRAGITKKTKLGNAEGAVGLLTKGRVYRIDYTKQAITMALIHLENEVLYKVK